MPRKRRFILPNLPHHAIQRGNNRQNVFFDAEDRSYFLKTLYAESIEQQVKVGAYCLMTNHVHLLLYPATAVGFMLFMKRIFQYYSQYLNRKRKRTGKLWENRYKLHLTDPDWQWWVARYIEKNPLRAGMVDCAEDYPFSSAGAHLLGVPDKILSQDILFGLRDRYRAFFHEVSSAEEAESRRLREAIQQEKAFGGEEFLKKVGAIFGFDFSIRKRGRPRRRDKLSPNN